MSSSLGYFLGLPLPALLGMGISSSCGSSTSLTSMACVGSGLPSLLLSSWQGAHLQWYTFSLRLLTSRPRLFLRLLSAFFSLLLLSSSVSLCTNPASSSISSLSMLTMSASSSSSSSVRQKTLWSSCEDSSSTSPTCTPHILTPMAHESEHLCALPLRLDRAPAALESIKSSAPSLSAPGR